MLVVGVGQCAWDTLAVVDRFPQIDIKKEVLSWEEQGGRKLPCQVDSLKVEFGV